MKTIDYDDNDGEYVVVNNTVHHRSKRREPVAQTVQRVYEEQFRKRWAEENDNNKPLTTHPIPEPADNETDDGIEIVTSTVYHGNGYDDEEDYTSYYNEPTNREEVLIEQEYDNTEAIEESIPELKNPPIEETQQEELIEEETENIEEDSDEELEEDAPEVKYDDISEELEASIDTAISAIIEKRVTLPTEDEDREEVTENVEEDTIEESEEETEAEEELAPEEPTKEIWAKKNPIAAAGGPQIVTPTTQSYNQEQPVIFKRKDPVLTYSMQQQLSNAMMASKDEEPDYSGYEPEEESNNAEAQYDDSVDYDDNEEPTYEKVSNKTKFKVDMSDY